MTTKRTALLAGATGLFFGIVIGASAAGSDDQANIDSAVASAVAAVTPAPTPEPLPEPTPRIVEVEVLSQDCEDALDLVMAQDLPSISFVVDVYSAYLDYPDEGLAEFGQRVETLLTDLDGPTEADLDESDRLTQACWGGS